MRFKEKDSVITFKAYLSFFFNNKFNFVLVPLTLLLFVLAEILLALFYRSLASYNAATGTGSFLIHGSSIVYWRLLGLMLMVYFMIVVLESIILSLCIVNSSNTAHRNMMNSIVRAPSSFFD